MSPTLGLDVDGVLYRWTEAAVDTFRDLRGKEMPSYGEDQYWDHIREYLTDDDWHWLWNSRKARHRMFRTGRAYADGIRAARELEKLCDVVIVSKRPRDVMVDTMAWLSQHRLNPHAVILVGMGEKHEHPWKLDAYVDDKPVNCLSLAEEWGIPVFSPVRGYNSELEGEDSVTRFDDWSTVVDWAIEAAAMDSIT